MTSRPVTITLPMNSSNVPAEPRAREAYLSKLAVFIEHSDGERELVKAGQSGLMYQRATGLSIRLRKLPAITASQTVLKAGK